MLKIAELAQRGDLRGLLEVAREFHGHICPYVSLGVKASLLAMRELGVARLSFEESVQESILAIVECNNCFADGVQVTTGCTLGNNSLIYFDLGKDALTLVRRGGWEGVRIYVDGERLREGYFPKEAVELFERVITRREGTSGDRDRLKQVWGEIGYQMLELPEEEFKVQRVEIPPIEPAPIFKSLRCSSCGELAMETRAIQINGKPHCLRCAKKSYYALIGRGIVERR